MRTLGLLLLCASLFVITSQAGEAALLIDAGPAAVQQQFSGGNYVAGTEFTTTSTLTVRSLGWLDVEGDGLGENHTVGLWDVSTQTLLATATVTPSSSTLLSAQGVAVWFLEDVAPLSLAPGVYRVAGTVPPDSHLALSEGSIGNGVTLSAGYVRTDFPNGGFGFPNLTFGSNAIRATVSTDAVGVTVPESSTIALALPALCMVGAIVLRRRSK